MENKRAYIIHGWNGYPEEGWFPWLKAELEQRGFTVEVPNMPHPAEPTIKDWVGHLAKLVGEPDEQTYFIGHSIGCQTIIRYLESLPSDRKVGGAIFIAGWFTLMNLKTDEEEQDIAQPWLETPIDFAKVKAATTNMTLILSDNDKWVPFEQNKQLFEQYLNPKIIIERGKEHFNGSSGIKELPVVLEAIEQYIV